MSKSYFGRTVITAIVALSTAAIGIGSQHDYVYAAEYIYSSEYECGREYESLSPMINDTDPIDPKYTVNISYDGNSPMSSEDASSLKKAFLDNEPLAAYMKDGTLTEESEIDIKITNSTKNLSEYSAQIKESFIAAAASAYYSKAVYMSSSATLSIDGVSKGTYKDTLSVPIELNITIPTALRGLGVVSAYIVDGVNPPVVIGQTEDTAATKLAVSITHFGDIIMGVRNTGKTRFSDVPDDSWYRDTVYFASDNNIMSGILNDDGTVTTFNPTDRCTREMVLRILYNMEGSPAVSGKTPFTDVPTNKWYSPAVKWGLDHKIMVGYSDTEFGRGRYITREMVAQTLFNYAAYKGYNTTYRSDLAAYADTNRISDWALEAVRWANGFKIIGGRLRYERMFLQPANYATRAETAQMIKNFIEIFGMN